MKECPYCKDFNPHWKRIVNEFPTINTEKIERNENPQLIKKFNVMSYPNITLSKGNKFVEFSGDRGNLDAFRSFFLKNGIKIE